ncbi:hypothetical protein PsYK624_059500 [Phanerochaete sordida]|uniref:Protein kinase domain-containing protein n=1 Tax=Phanerochaete sordida TaxID=48140 RepID=A0A9P3G8H5_9APHY|nr:hypothetical protein PsYK624_059500 [Phanerochaete sordida]
MYAPLEILFDEIGTRCGANRKFYNTRSSGTTLEDQFLSSSLVQPDFILRDQSDDATKASKISWRVVLACVKVKCPRSDGPHYNAGDGSLRKVKNIVAQAADYSRIHLAHRPFQLFSMTLLIYGSFFNVSVYDRGGVVHSQEMAMYDDNGLTDNFILVVRRMLKDLAVEELGQEQGVSMYSSIENDTTGDHYPRFLVPAVANQPAENNSWITTGLAVWSSYSLIGRGTAVWRVEHPKTQKVYIMKSAWRHTDRRPEAEIYRYLQSKRLTGTRGIADFLVGEDVSLVCADQHDRALSVNALRPSDAVLDEDIILHRVVLPSVGRPLWEFDDPEHFLRALLAIVKGIEALQKHGILHRDLSIGNVLLSADRREGYEAFLTDFEFARIEAIVDEHNPVTIMPLPKERTLPSEATNTRTRSTINRGPQMTGTLQFMAIDLLRNVVSYYGQLFAAGTSTDAAPTISTQHEVKHDLESLIWVADYALYRRAFERTKNLPSKDPARGGVQRALKQDFGHTKATQIVQARSAMMLPTFWLDFERQHVLAQIEEPLGAILLVLMTQVLAQNTGTAAQGVSNPDFVQKILTITGTDNTPKRAGQPLTCGLLDSVLSALLLDVKP